MEIATKITGGTLDATEFNQIPDELENAISSTSQVPASGDLFQVAKAIVDYAAHGDFYTDSGAADAYVLSATGSKQSPTAYVAGFRGRFSVGNTNTGVSTVNIATLGAQGIKRPDGTALKAGDLIAGEIVTIEYDGTDFLLQKTFNSNFNVNKNGTDQAGVVTSTWTKLTWSTEEFDTNSDFASDTFTPLIAGEYDLHAQAQISAMGDGDKLKISIYKNGVLYLENEVGAAAATSVTAPISVTVQANGSTDFFDVYIWHDFGSNKDVVGDTTMTRFSGGKKP